MLIPMLLVFMGALPAQERIAEIHPKIFFEETTEVIRIIDEPLKMVCYVIPRTAISCMAMPGVVEYFITPNSTKAIGPASVQGQEPTTK